MAAPAIIVPWYAWCMYEFIMLDKPGGIILVVCATVGGVIGGVIGLSINRKVVRKAEEILSQIEELQKD